MIHELNFLEDELDNVSNRSLTGLGRRAERGDGCTAEVHYVIANQLADTGSGATTSIVTDNNAFLRSAEYSSSEADPQAF